MSFLINDKYAKNDTIYMTYKQLRISSEFSTLILLSIHFEQSLSPPSHLAVHSAAPPVPLLSLSMMQEIEN